MTLIYDEYDDEESAKQWYGRMASIIFEEFGVKK